MKKLSYILSALLVMFGAAGYYLAFTVADYNVKSEMFECIQSSSHRENLIQFSFSKDELNKEVQFTDGKKEFIYKGEHYDVVKSVSRENRLLLTCLKDSEETFLFSFFRKNLDEQAPSSNSSGKILVKTFSPDWFFQSSSSSFLPEKIIFISKEEISFPINQKAEIPAPPPKV